MELQVHKPPTIPPCLLCADKLRLQQVLDNIFANSYKYADTEIVVAITKESRCLVLVIEDFGGGVPDEELPLLKEKFRRGSNVGDREGAGLGLFISDYFMKEMQGELRVENGAGGPAGEREDSVFIKHKIIVDLLFSICYPHIKANDFRGVIP